MVQGRSSEHDMPLFMRQIISSQLDVDRMDYLCRDAHFAGVSIGQIDVQYLIRCLRVISHGSQRTLGLTAKGVACYEAFALSRHLMNKSVYYHKQVATFESMMEECLRLLVKESTDYLPAFLHEVREIQPDQSNADVQDKLFESYLSLTEHQVWTALGEATGRQGRLGQLANQLLHRRAVPSIRVASGKHELLESELSSRFRTDQFRVRASATSPYKQASGEQVFVLDESTGVAVHISEKSSIVDTLRDRSDTEAVLVIFDEAAAAEIEAAANQADCLQTPRRRPSPPSNRPPLAKTSADVARAEGEPRAVGGNSTPGK
jgi:HD superfamily phosphohydrolase